MSCTSYDHVAERRTRHARRAAGRRRSPASRSSVERGLDDDVGALGASRRASAPARSSTRRTLPRSATLQPLRAQLVDVAPFVLVAAIAQHVGERIDPGRLGRDVPSATRRSSAVLCRQARKFARSVGETDRRPFGRSHFTFFMSKKPGRVGARVEADELTRGRPADPVEDAAVLRAEIDRALEHHDAADETAVHADLVLVGPAAVAFERRDPRLAVADDVGVELLAEFLRLRCRLRGIEVAPRAGPLTGDVRRPLRSAAALRLLRGTA